MKNSLSIIGRLGADPEVRYTAAGKAVTTLSVCATNGQFGERQADQWFRATFWGKPAEVAGEYLKKGDLVEISGPVRLETYDRKDGGQGASLEIEVRDFTLIPTGDRQKPDPAPQAEPEPVEANATVEDEGDDEIPF